MQPYSQMTQLSTPKVQFPDNRRVARLPSWVECSGPLAACRRPGVRKGVGSDSQFTIRIFFYFASGACRTIHDSGSPKD